jgi:peptide/nickel transport system substrate-binding protein
LRRKLRFVLPLAVIAATALTLIGYSSAGENNRAASDTLVYGASADPASLDPSLNSDGESLRPTAQIFESLIGFKPGTSNVVPGLATAWKVSKNHLAWAFTLRKGVQFSDGTPFNAAAVCFNFTRWYHFPAPLQSDALSYYWQTVFGGFAKPAPGSPGPDKSLYKGCKAHGPYSVSILLQRPSTSFLSAIGLPNFGIASPAALTKYQADAGTVDSTGVFHPTGSFATQHPIGTGPYMLQSWQPGNKLVLVANPKYHGAKPKIRRIIYIPIGDSAARLQAFQSGELQAYDNVGPQDFATIRGNKKYKLFVRPPTSIGYVGINQAIPPMNNPLVRQAVAYGLNGAVVAKAFYGGVGTPATQFLPPSLVGYAKKGVPAYPYNPSKSIALLKQAGLNPPVKVDFWYPTNISRPYMPDPQRNFEAFAASLGKAGFQVVAHSAPWRPDYRAGVLAGRDQLYLFGWNPDFVDPDNYLNVHFGSKLAQFGFSNPALFALLARADAEPDLDKRAALYQQASVQVMKLLPMVPYVWAAGAIALDNNIKGFVPSPIGTVNESMATLSYG